MVLKTFYNDISRARINFCSRQQYPFMHKCNSTLNYPFIGSQSDREFTFSYAILYCMRKPISHESRSDESDIRFEVQFNAEFTSQVMNFP